MRHDTFTMGDTELRVKRADEDQDEYFRDVVCPVAVSMLRSGKIRNGMWGTRPLFNLEMYFLRQAKHADYAATLILETIRMATSAEHTRPDSIIPPSMSDEQAAIELTKSMERAVEYTPVGQDRPIRLTVGAVRNMIAIPSKRGVLPTEADCVMFIMLCRARGLDPFIRDAFLIGYDNYKDGKYVSTSWQMIVSYQAYIARAESNPSFDGMESGIVYELDGHIAEAKGKIAPTGAKLRGAWAKIYRNDRNRPVYTTINLDAYKPRSPTGRWATDPEGMLVKCAKCEVIRDAFPFTSAGVGAAFETTLTEANVAAALSDLGERVEAVAQQKAAAARVSDTTPTNDDPHEQLGGDETLEQSPPEPTPDDAFDKFEIEVDELLSAAHSLTAVDEAVKLLRKDFPKDNFVAHIDLVAGRRKQQIRNARGEHSNVGAH